ncbi:MAG: DUF937 domain-containing protein, partial [Actinomycetota bacterium]
MSRASGGKAAMPGLMDEMMGALNGADGGLGGLLGGVLGGQADARSEKAAGLGMEAILGGLAKNAQDPKGAESLLSALDKHDGSALDNLGPGFGSAESTADGEKIIGHVFGDDREAVTQNLAAKSGLDAGSIAKMLPALAPVVMGMLGKKKAGSGMDAGGLAGLLKAEVETVG